MKDLFSGIDSPDLEAALTKLEQQVARFEKLRPQLKADLPVSNFLEIIKESEEITVSAWKLSSFAELAFEADTQNQSGQALMVRIQQFMAELENRTMFFTLWWKNLDDANAERLMEGSGDTRYYLEKLR